MTRLLPAVFTWCVCCGLVVATANAQDWPQWRGPNRDGALSEFQAPAQWPSELEEAWSQEVGDGVAGLSLADGKIYVFARQNDQEVLRCLDAQSGEEVWQDAYNVERFGGPDSGYQGPRATPAVADGMVAVLGVQGELSCYNAETGAVAWRKNEYSGDVPRFHTSSSPLITNGLCIAQLGGSDQGGMIAYDLQSGEERWRWDGDGPSYGSPVMMTVGDMRLVVAPTSENLVALTVSDGEQKWQIPYEQGRYNAATPIVHGDMLIVAGPGNGMTALRLSASDGAISEERVWRNTDNSVIYNTPAFSDGLLLGLTTSDQLFCMDAQTGETAWTAPYAQASGDGAAEAQAEDRGERRRGRGRRGRGRGRSGYGAIVAGGGVAMAIAPAGELVVFKAAKDGYEELARYRVAGGGTYAYPVAVGDRIYVKGQEALVAYNLP